MATHMGDSLTTNVIHHVLLRAEVLAVMLVVMPRGFTKFLPPIMLILLAVTLLV